MSHYPERIVCLTEETTELLYLLGQQDRIVGISGFTKRPIQARSEKPIVSSFVDAKIDNFKSSPFQHHRHQIFPNVVNIPLHLSLIHI